MIEKLKPNEDKIFRTESGEMMVVPALNVPQYISDKINELVDAVNALQVANVHIQNDLFETLHKCPTTITNDYTVIKYDELCRLREAADELARLKGLKGFQN